MSAQKGVAQGETWRPVVGYEGYYEGSSHGRVRSLDREILTSHGRKRFYRGQPIRQLVIHYYARIGLTKNGVTTKWCVHRLVCEAFHCPKPFAEAVVRHLNGKHTDNRPENLTWGTRAENSADMVRHGNAYWGNQTQCIRGHDFSEKNTYRYVSPAGVPRRSCRECDRTRSVAKNAQRDAAKRAARPFHECAVCGTRFQSSYRQVRFCSRTCVAASRRVGFKRSQQRRAA